MRSRILVTGGAGAVGGYAIQFAKDGGAKVISTISSEEKAGLARSFGADHTINYKSDPEWGKTVRALTGGRGVDHVIEVGGPGTLAQSIAAVRMSWFSAAFDAP